MSRVAFGIDQLLAAPDALRGRLGLVTNDAARTAADARLHSRVALQRAGFQLVRLFSPEHGLAARAPDGATVADGVDPLTGLPIVSLYGERLRPPREMLADLDAVLFDIPDVGARFYTYIWTLSHVLEACAEAGVPLVVLDRPNPLGGDLAAAEGPMLDVERFASFVGRAAMPIRHSLTVGELAQLWNAAPQPFVAADVSPLHLSVNQSGLTSAAAEGENRAALRADLRIIPCSGWQRAMHWPDTGLTFVPTSPAIASYEAALLYPGLCLFEATNLSVGRGTPDAFQAIGAPWLRAGEAARRFNGLSLIGVSAQAGIFKPNLAPHAAEHCEAVRLAVNQPKSFRPVAAGLLLLATVMELHREELRWANYPTAANPGGENHFARLVGRAGVREVLEESHGDVIARVEEWTATPGWPERARGILLYA